MKVKLNQTDTATFYGPNYLKWPFAQDFWFTRNYLGQVAQGSLPNSPFNETHWANPQFQKLIKQAQAELNTAKRTELLHEAQTDRVRQRRLHRVVVLQPARRLQRHGDRLLAPRSPGCR